MKWWQKEVIYQIYPRSFCDSNNDGIGDLLGIVSKLDYLKSLGVGALWLSPVYKSPNEDNGYDISDYRDINEEYGTLDDMKLLIKEAKSRNIRIIMDLVINHTSDEHKWFLSSYDPSSEFHNYYIWKPGQVSHDGTKLPPNNWDSQFTGSAWSYCSKNDLWYLHLFSPKQPDLNYHNPKVIEEVENIMRFWLDLGVAGFRCDVINFIYKTSLDNGVKRFFNKGMEHYLSQPGNHEILRKFNDDVLKPYDAFTVGEISHISPQSATQFVTNELTTVFSFEHLEVDQWQIPLIRIKYRPSKMKKALLKWQKILDWNTVFLENHDVPRSLSRFGDEGIYRNESAKMLATLVLTLRGTTFLYQGEEIGQVNSIYTDISQVQDIAARNVYKILKGYGLSEKRTMKFVNNFNRDHARTPMPWNKEVNGGFSSTKPWITMTEGFQKLNVQSQITNVDSIWSYYQRLIAIKKKQRALQDGLLTPIELGSEILAFIRTSGKEKITVAINLGPKARTIKQKLSGQLLIGNYPEKEQVNLEKLQPYQAILIKTE